MEPATTGLRDDRRPTTVASPRQLLELKTFSDRFRFGTAIAENSLLPVLWATMYSSAAATARDVTSYRWHSAAQRRADVITEDASTA